jgi:hypothetical protein
VALTNSTIDDPITMLLIILQNFLLNHAEPAINLSFDAIDNSHNNVSEPAKFHEIRRIGAEQLWTLVNGSSTQQVQTKPPAPGTSSMRQRHSNLISERQMQTTSRAVASAPPTTTTTTTTTTATTTTALATKSHNENSGNNGMMIDEIGMDVTTPPSVLSRVCLFVRLCVC